MADQPRLSITITPDWQAHRPAPDGSVYAIGMRDWGVDISRWDGQVAATTGIPASSGRWTSDAPGFLGRSQLSPADYDAVRQAHPELALPAYQPPAPGTNANGNTLGKVVGPSPPASVPATGANPPVSPETAAEADTGAKALDALQLGLDVAGLIPGIGEFADLANAGISAARGDWVGAGLSLAAAIPFGGWAATGAKAAKRVAAEAGAKAAKEAAEQAAKHADEVAEQTAKHSDELGDATKKGEDGGKVEGPRQTSLREQYLGRNPSKNSRTGREVQERMRAEGKLRDGPDGPEFQASNDKWYPLKDADMSHKTDAVTWWNETGRHYGAKSPEVRDWMLDPDNYRLDHYSINRAAGARLPDRYLPPVQ